MAGSVNKVILVGNLGNDPDIRTMQSGDKVANLSVATSESWKDKATGERKERTEWHRVVIFNKGLVMVAENYLKKGAKVYIEGAVETRKWTDQSGVEKYTTEIVLRPFRSELTMLDSRNSGAGAGGGYNQGAGFQDNNGGDYGNGAPQAAPQAGAPAAAAAAPQIDEMEDDIPF